MKVNKFGLLATLAILSAALSGSAATATSITWSSHDTGVDPSNNANWSNPINWVGGVAPVATDDLIFPVPAVNGTRTTNNDLPANTQINGISITANQYILGGNAINIAGPVSFSAGGANTATITLAQAMQQNTTYNVSANTSNGRLQIDGNITGAFNVTKADAGRLRFAVTPKTYTGDTIVTGGILDTGSDNVMPFGAGRGSLFLGAGTQFILNNNTTNINGLNDYSGGSGSVSKVGSNTRNLTLGNGDANGVFSGTLTFAGGTSTIGKIGTGTQTLNGAVTVLGPGLVSNGRLNVNSTWSNGVNVNSPGVLGGTGSIAGAIGGTGTVAPGMSIGTLNAASANLASGAVLQIELSGVGSGSADILNISGALNITTTTVDFNKLSALGDPVYVFAQYGSLAGTPAFASVVDLPPSYYIDYAYQGNKIALVTIPEPATCVLAFAAALATLGVRRRES